MINGDGTKTSITLDELTAMDIPVKPVPNLYAANAAAAAASGVESPAAAALLLDKTKALEEELVAERTSTAALHQQVNKLQKIVDALGAPALGAAAADASIDVESAEAAAPAPASGKRAAKPSAAAGKRVRRDI